MDKEKHNEFVRKFWNARHSEDISKFLKEYEALCQSENEKRINEANDEIIKLRKLLYQVEVFIEQENMNSDYDGIWRDNDEDILASVKENSLNP